MRVAIDCRWIFPKISGVGKYTKNLVDGLCQIDRKNRYILLNTPLVPYGIYSFSNQTRLPRLLRSLDIDVYHSTNFMIPLFMSKKTKVVVTVHDLIPYLYPEYTPKAKKTKYFNLFKRILHRVVKRADRIIAISKNTAEDLHKHLMVPYEKINVIYNSISPDFFLENIASPEGHILFVGRMDPYKNITGLIMAYRKLVRDYKIMNKLVIVGEEDPRYPEALDLIKEFRLEGMVEFYGYAEQEKLVSLYKSASVLVLPSFYEGFGIPVFEAMACGVPVVVSNTPALVETTGNERAVVVNPNSINEIAEGIYTALSDMKRREGLIYKGKTFIRDFTINKMAEETLKVYENSVSA